MWSQKAHKIHRIYPRKHKEKRGNLDNNWENRTAPYVIGVCGGSGSGKTTFCREFASVLGTERIVTLSQDAYYKDLGHLPQGERLKTNFDHPEQIEFSLLATHLDQLFLGKSVTLPKYDFATCERTPSFELITPKPIIIVEGLLIFHNPEIQQRLDYKLYIDVDEEIRLQRKVERDIYERGRTKDMSLKQYQLTTGPMHHKYVEASKDFADKIISGDQSFESEIAQLLQSVVIAME